MPEHSNWLSWIIENVFPHFEETLKHNASGIGNSMIGNAPPTAHSFYPLLTALLIAFLLVGIGYAVRGKMLDKDAAVVPDDKLTLRTFMEVFLGYFYDLAKSVMGPERAKQYFPVIGASACFIFTANVMALLPGFPVATSSLSITLGCALVVFILFNIYGLWANGWDYVAHLAGPAWYLAPLLFPIEVISLFVRPVTLAVRLMLNMAVDHLILGIFMGLVATLVPVPVMMLGVLVVVVQTLVFTLLTCIYIGLATEHIAH